MSERGLKQLVGALSIAIGVWLITVVFSGGSGSIGASREMSGFFDGVDAESLTSLVMVGEEGTVTLAREGGGAVPLRGAEAWTVNGYRADPVSVSRLLDVFGQVEVGDLIASNPSNHERMGVSSDRAVTVTFVTGGSERSLIVGDNGRRFGTAYVRLPGADEVYLLEGDLGAQVRRDEASWRDRTMAAIDSAGVSRIVVERPEGAYTLARGDSAWTVEGSGSAAAVAVTGILAELSTLVATGFLADSDSIALLDRESVTRAFDESGAMLAEITIGSGEGNRWARTNTDDYLYQVSSFRADRVAPSREDVAGES